MSAAVSSERTASYTCFSFSSLSLHLFRAVEVDPTMCEHELSVSTGIACEFRWKAYPGSLFLASATTTVAAGYVRLSVPG